MIAICTFVVGLNLGALIVIKGKTTNIEIISKPSTINVIDLPEEVNLITLKTPIEGYIKSDTLFIRFKHNY